MTTPASAEPDRAASVATLLARAVEALGGQHRPGQLTMARAVGDALDRGEHLLVQAGTGTGKSLAYLVPALVHARRVVVATATLALQHQLVERDLPRLVEALEGIRPGGPEVPVDTTYAVLKGRANYACLHRIREGVPDDQGVLVEVPDGSLGTEVVALRSWAEQQSATGGTGEKDHAPRHTERVWRQVSVSHRECLGTRCPYADECFAERARERAQASHLVVTNHSLLAIDAVEGVPMIPEYDAVVVDEAHELTARVTQAATDELAVADVERTARRCRRWVDGDGDRTPADDLTDAAAALAATIESTPPGRLDTVPEALGQALAMVRDAARACLSAFPKDAADADAGRAQARGMAQEVFSTSDRMAGVSESDVLWVTEARDRVPARLCVAPLQVSGPMRDRLLSAKTVVFTSATLRLGGDFTAVATSLGLRADERVTEAPAGEASRRGVSADASGGTTGETSGDVADDAPREPADDRAGDRTGDRAVAVADEAGPGSHRDGVLPWRALDVGSPFDYRRQAIVYVARHLPRPGRDGLSPAQADEIVALVDAAGGRTLGLFSSRRAAVAAAEAVRERLPHLTTLAQGDAQLPELARQFVADPHTCLFGTLSLWQGLDVPGDTCQLVIVDRIPFPRPDDPLMSARQRAVDRDGGNGFMQVAATHAALLLAQGSGRLIRTPRDRGVVAVLDPRLVTARYGRFLRASLPEMWHTTDPGVVRAALRRLAAAGAVTGTTAATTRD